MSGLQKIIDLKRSQKAVGESLGVSQQRVHSWLINGVPAAFVIPLAALVEFLVCPHEIAPDLYPHAEDGLPADMRCLATSKTHAHPHAHVQKDD